MLFELANVELLAGEPQAARAFADRALASPELRPDDLASPWLARRGHAYLLIAAAAHQGPAMRREQRNSWPRLRRCSIG